MITFLGWSLLGASEDFDPMTSADFPSQTLARILYAAFLVMGVILLVNMLIALLSNTYQRIEVRKYMQRVVEALLKYSTRYPTDSNTKEFTLGRLIPFRPSRHFGITLAII